MNIVLTLCGISNTCCLFMADPLSCPNYDEDNNRSYAGPCGSYENMKPAEIAKAESKRIDMEVESFSEFADRIEAELDGLGVKVEKTEETEEAPDWF